MNALTCSQCLEYKDTTVVWGKRITEKGRVKFWREMMCFDCRENIKKDGGDVR